jgi:hypothetical protein
VPPGFFQVLETVPAGHTAVNAFPGPAGGFRASPTLLQLTAVAGANVGSNNFLVRRQLSTISGSVFRDVNGNSVVDVPPDQPLSGIQILLQTMSGGFLAQTFTDVNGAWAFGNLSPGTYRVVEVTPSNLTSVAAFPGPGGFAINADTIQVTVAGGVYGNNNFLDRLSRVSPTVGIISGSVFRDTNGNGIVDVPPDQPVPGVPIQLFTQSGIFIGQTTTDRNGAWAFGNVPPGFYRVVEVVPAGYVPVNAFPGPAGGFGTSVTTLQLTAVAGVNVGSNNFLIQAIRLL